MLMSYEFTLDSVFKSIPPKTQSWLANHANILLSYVHETVFAWKTAFLQDSCHSFYGRGQLLLCQCYLKMHDVGEGPGASLWVLRHFISLINRLRGAWWAAVHGVPKSRTWLSDFTFTFLFHALEKEMATHSSVLAWRIPGTGKPGGLPSMGSHRIGDDWSDLAAVAVAGAI